MVNDSNLECFYYEDRKMAANMLLDTLPVEVLKQNETIVIGVSEGGVYFADRLAMALNAQMDILLTEAICAPNNPEVAIAMISESEEVVMHKALVDAFDISEDFVYAEAHRKYEEEILSYLYKYRKGKDPLTLKGKYVVLVDDCIETGLTMMVALKSAIAREAKNIYIATPILDKVVYENLVSVCDGVYCPHRIQDYISIEYYYKNFKTATFEEISKIIQFHEHREKEKSLQKVKE